MTKSLQRWRKARKGTLDWLNRRGYSGAIQVAFMDHEGDEDVGIQA